MCESEFMIAGCSEDRGAAGGILLLTRPRRRGTLIGTVSAIVMAALRRASARAVVSVMLTSLHSLH